MADTAAVRQRRHRLHAAGDHSLCSSRCGGERPAPRDEVRTAIAKYLASSGVTDDRLELQAALLLRAAEQVDQAGTPGSIRALTELLDTHRRHIAHIRYETEDDGED